MLTAKQLNGIKPTGRTYRLWDGDRSGFGVQVTPRGTVTFFLQYRLEGKQRFMGFGRYHPDLKIVKARERIAAARSSAAEARRLVQAGIDPQKARDQEKLSKKVRDEGSRVFEALQKVQDVRDKVARVHPEKAEELTREVREASEKASEVWTSAIESLSPQKDVAPTVADAVPDYLRLYRGRPSEKAIVRYFENDVVPAIGGLKVKDVEEWHIIELVEKKAAGTPTAARHLLAYTKRFFHRCKKKGYIKLNPASGIEPKDIEAEGKKNVLAPVHRSRFLSDAEIRSFWHSVEGCRMRRLTALALKLTLVSGQRPGEICGMRWDEIEEGVWTIPASRRGKTDSSHTVPLSPLAVAIISDAREEVKRLQARRATEPTGYVFEAEGGKPLAVNALSKAVARHADQLGMKGEPWRPHDLRRTCRTGLPRLGFISEVAEMVIGHEKQDMERVYNQYSYDKEKKKALDAWAAHLEELVA